MGKLDDYETKLLEGWQDVHKKSQLTLWILLALKDGAKHMAEIKECVQRLTKNTISADDQSMYRALRRFYDAEIVDFTAEAGDGGPDRKVYKLTKTGSNVLDAFLKEHIIDVFYDKANQILIEK